MYICVHKYIRVCLLKLLYIILLCSVLTHLILYSAVLCCAVLSMERGGEREKRESQGVVYRILCTYNIRYQKLIFIKRNLHVKSEKHMSTYIPYVHMNVYTYVCIFSFFHILLAYTYVRMVNIMKIRY